MLLIKNDNDNPFDDVLGAFRGVYNATVLSVLCFWLPLGIIWFYVGSSN